MTILRVLMRAGVLLAALWVAVIPADAQVSGRISGTVTDPSGDVIVAAEVTLTNSGTGEAFTAQSNAIGFFVFPNLQPGTYTVNVRADGFRAYERTGIILNANQILSLTGIQLTIGSVTEVITVEAVGATVETERTGNSSFLTNNQLDGLLSYPLALMSPGPAKRLKVRASSRTLRWNSRTRHSCRGGTISFKRP